MDLNQEKEIIAEVRERFPDVEWPDVYTTPCWYGRKGRDRFEDRFVIVMTPPGAEREPVQVCTDQYKLVRHEVAFKQFEDRIKEVPELGEPLFDFSMIFGGRKFKCVADFPEVKLEIRVGDPINPRAGVKSSYDLGWEFSSFMGAKRVVCTNGMVAWKTEAITSRKHRQNLSVEGQLEDMVIGLKNFSDRHELWKTWAEKQLEAMDIKVLLEDIEKAKVFGKGHMEEILALPEVVTHENLSKWKETGTSVWNVYNVFTQFLEHNVESDIVSQEKNEKISRMFEIRYAA